MPDAGARRMRWISGIWSCAVGALALGLLVASTPSRAETIAAYGDSLTTPDDWFFWMPPEWTMLDYGENGDECYADVIPRLLVDLATPGHPVIDADAVVIFCGTNDVRKTFYSEAQPWARSRMEPTQFSLSAFRS